MKIKFNVIHLFACFGFWSTSSIAGWFADENVLPQIKYVMLSPTTVAFVSHKIKFYDEVAFYFIYDRSSRNIVEIDAGQYKKRFPWNPPQDDLIQDPSDSGYFIGHTSGGVEYKLKMKYCGEGVTDDIREVLVNNKAVSVQASKECTSVTRVEIVKDQLWLGTAYSGEAGISGAEGIIVQQLNGKSVLAKLNTDGAVVQIKADPVSNNVWVVTDKAIYEISQQFKIVSVNFYYHDFDPITGLPRLSLSSKATSSNPFAVISRLLSTEDRKNFYQTFAKIPERDLKKFKLYDFYMCCDWHAPKYPESFRPLAPFFIKASMRKDTELKNSWLQSLCRLGGAESEQYCH